VPLYEYQCKSCQHRFEKIQKFSDPLVTLCPKCGMESVEQLLSAPAVQFKGSGWYVTDYAGKKPSSSGSSNGNGNGTGTDSSASTAKSETSTTSTSTASTSESK
jgi:putative FmdB family regulatory protein